MTDNQRLRIDAVVWWLLQVHRAHAATHHALWTMKIATRIVRYRLPRVIRRWLFFERTLKALQVAFGSRIDRAVRHGVRAYPALYTSPHERAAGLVYIYGGEIMSTRASPPRPEDYHGFEHGLEAAQRWSRIIAVAGFLLGVAAISFQLITTGLNALRGWEAYIWDSAIPHWLPVSLLIPYVLHISRVFRPLRDPFHDAVASAVNSLEGEVLRRLEHEAPGLTPELLIPRWELGQNIAAINQELARDASGTYMNKRSIDVIVFGFMSTGDVLANSRKGEFYRQALKESIRDDALFLPYAVVSSDRLIGSAVTLSEPWTELEQSWNDYREHSTDLPERFEDANVSFFLINDHRSSGDFELFELPQASTAFIPIPVPYRGRWAMSVEAGLGGQYRLFRDAPRGLKSIARPNNLYEGPPPLLEGEGITDLAAKENAKSVVEEGLGVIILNGGGLVETIREKPTLNQLKKTVKGSPTLRNQIDEENLLRPQYDAAVGLHAIHLGSELHTRFSRLIRAFIGNAKQIAEELNLWHVDVDLTEDVMIPLQQAAISREAVQTYLGYRVASLPRGSAQAEFYRRLYDAVFDQDEAMEFAKAIRRPLSVPPPAEAAFVKFQSLDRYLATVEDRVPGSMLRLNEHKVLVEAVPLRQGSARMQAHVFAESTDRMAYNRDRTHLLRPNGNHAEWTPQIFGLSEEAFLGLFKIQQTGAQLFPTGMRFRDAQLFQKTPQGTPSKIVEHEIQAWAESAWAQRPIYINDSAAFFADRISWNRIQELFEQGGLDYEEILRRSFNRQDPPNGGSGPENWIVPADPHIAKREGGAMADRLSLPKPEALLEPANTRQESPPKVETPVELFTLLTEKPMPRQIPADRQAPVFTEDPMAKHRFDPAMIERLRGRVLAFDLSLFVERGQDGALHVNSTTFHAKLQELLAELAKAFGPEWPQYVHVVSVNFDNLMESELATIREAAGRLLPALRSNEVVVLSVLDIPDLMRRLNAQFPGAPKTLVVTDQHLLPPGRAQLRRFTDPAHVVIARMPRSGRNEILSGSAAVVMAVEPEALAGGSGPKPPAQREEWDALSRTGVIEFEALPVTADFAVAEAVDRRVLTDQLTGRQARALQDALTAA
jgi:hypothetical protein